MARSGRLGIGGEQATTTDARLGLAQLFGGGGGVLVLEASGSGHGLLRVYWA
ncbi:MAG: hypothetical protein ACP5G7_03370 [Anaerolineae bacterium]